MFTLSRVYGKPHTEGRVPVDHADLKRLLGEVESEQEAVASQLAALQVRSSALAKTAEGIRALLEMTPEVAPWSVGVLSSANHAAPVADTQRAEGIPKGKGAAKLILESDQSRFWNVRDVHDEEVRRGWAEPRPPGAPGNPPSRIALQRLAEEYPDNVEVQTEPVLAYRWTSKRPPSVNGSGPSDPGEETS